MRTIIVLIIIGISVLLFYGCTRRNLLIRMNKTENIDISIEKISIDPRKTINEYPEYFFYSPPQFLILRNHYLFMKIGTHDIFRVDLKTGESEKICRYGMAPGELLDFEPLIFLNDNEEINISGIHSKLNIYDSMGKLTKSMNLPNYQSAGFRMLINNKLLKYNWVDGIGVMDSVTGEEREIFKIDQSQKDFLEKYDFWLYLRNLFLVYSGRESIIITQTNSSNVQEYSLDGQLLHEYTEVPNHYVPFRDAVGYSAPPDYSHKDLKTNRKEHFTWLDSWTFTHFPVMFGENHFIVSRRRENTLYLDFYSLKERKYLGHTSIEDKFMVGTSGKDVYLGKWEDLGKITIEKYSVSFDGKVREAKKIKRSKFVIAEEVKELYPDQFDNMNYIREKEYNRKDETITSKHIFKDFNNEEYRITDKLNKEKNYHFLILTRNPNDGKCQFLTIMKQAIEFCVLNRDFDVNIIVTNPNVEEIGNSALFYELSDANVFFNIEPERTFGYYYTDEYPKYPWATIVMLDSKGNTLKGFQYDSNFPESLSNYFNECVHVIKGLNKTKSE